MVFKHNMSIITTNKNALKLLRIDGTNSLQTNAFSVHEITDTNSSKSKKKKKIDINISSKSNGKFNYDDCESSHHSQDKNISDYIRKISEMEPTPEYSSDSDDNEDDDFYDINDNKDKHKKGADVVEGIELMLRRLQSEAKQIEQSRYQQYANDIHHRVKITKSSPNEIIKLTQNTKSRSSKSKKNLEAMNWWDQPFRDHLRSAKRPIIRETGIDQFASEYMLTMLREQEQSVLQKRQQVEFKRTRKPIDNWYEMKSTQFGNELRRHNRQM